VSDRERPLTEVPPWHWLLLAACLAAQLVWQALPNARRHAVEDLPPAPRPIALRLASFGETAAAARLAMIYVQSFDLRAGNDVPFRRLDYGRLLDWLRAILATDPRSQYPLFAAARVYTEIPDDAKVRQVLGFLYQEFVADPNQRWRWLAQAALIAKYRLHDMPLALRYASALQHDATAPDVPAWAKQMVIFMLEDMNELQAAKILLGGLLASGQLTDPAERRFLKRRLEELEDRIQERGAGASHEAPQKR
jgi:hypothetical protein